MDITAIDLNGGLGAVPQLFDGEDDVGIQHMVEMSRTSFQPLTLLFDHVLDDLDMMTRQVYLHSVTPGCPKEWPKTRILGRPTLAIPRLCHL
jgi:hypothetical protein